MIVRYNFIGILYGFWYRYTERKCQYSTSLNENTAVHNCEFLVHSRGGINVTQPPHRPSTTLHFAQPTTNFAALYAVCFKRGNSKNQQTVQQCA